MSMNVHQEKPQKSSGKKFFEWASKCFYEYRDPEKWIKDMKTSIGIAVSITATITFSLGTNPPGGVVQVSKNDIPFSTNHTFCSFQKPYHICAGEAIMATSKSGDYLAFLVCNLICFISSLSVLFFLVSGIPIRKTVLIWLLSFGMCVTLTSLALTYLFAVFMVTPDAIWNNLLDSVFGLSVVIWASSVVLLAAFFILRPIVRGVHKVCNCMGCQ
ncbi:unnamed protein product [Lathyrus sativus]|nr:unnamed protein product [Lathyrus sativus]